MSVIQAVKPTWAIPTNTSLTGTPKAKRSITQVIWPSRPISVAANNRVHETFSLPSLAWRAA
jgi:hypothetical protein